MAGVLMPIASLPSDDGVGSLGRSAYQLVDFLNDTGFRLWQVLPLNPLGYGNSPYQPFSSFAGDELYIDLDLLADEGYLPQKRKKLRKKKRIDYEAARAHKLPYLKEAFKEFDRQGREKEEFEQFCKQDWVYHYAVFIALKKNNDLRCWNEWPKDQQDWIIDQKFDISPFEEEIRFQMFLQYEFLKQWKLLKEYANKKDILMVGDIPFYVGIDSLDVWEDRDSFLLDQDGQPSFVAGVPPDYFSPEGQRWGNPIYNWDKLEQDGFRFWMQRLEYTAALYDIIRIDHFRAFDTYWKVPSSCKTAIDGEWIEAPGYALFDTLFASMPDLWIVAEDLGDLRPEVLELRDYYNLAGMIVAEFDLFKDDDTVNKVIYTGTHDNQTVVGWYNSLKPAERKKVDQHLRKEGTKDKNITYRMLHYVLNAPANIAIIPLMDLLGLDDSARLNTPATLGSPNWEWQLKDMEELEAQRTGIRRMLRYSKRLA